MEVRSEGALNTRTRHATEIFYKMHVCARLSTKTEVRNSLFCSFVGSVN